MEIETPQLIVGQLAPRSRYNGGVSSRIVRFVHALVIVPRAHVWFERMFQTEMYELFHRRPLARWGHAICTPVVNVALLAVLATLLPSTQIGPLAVDGALVGAAALVAWSLYVDIAAALVVLPLAALAVVGARALVALLGDHALVGALACAWGAGFLQAVSHASEPIPPPWTGSHRFVPLGTWLRTAPLSHVVTLALLSPTVFTLLEVWASPRVWVLQALHALMRAGYRPALRDQLTVRLVEMLEDTRTGWPQPDLPGATATARATG